MLGSDAAEFFENDEEMMTFATKHNIMAVHALILERQGKYGDSIRRLLKYDPTHLSEALAVAFRHISELLGREDLFDTIIDCFLWPFLSFGCRTWPESVDLPVGKIRKLLEAISNQPLDHKKRNTVS
jgi:hypothetical protein